MTTKETIIEITGGLAFLASQGLIIFIAFCWAYLRGPV